KDYSTSFVQGQEANGFFNWQFFPLTELRNGFNTNKSNTYDFRPTASLKYTIIEGLSAQILFQYEKAITNGTSYSDAQSYYTRDLVNQFSIVPIDKVT